MKTTLVFIIGYILALTVFFGGKLYAESFSNRTLKPTEVFATEKSKIQTPSNQNTNPTVLIVRYCLRARHLNSECKAPKSLEIDLSKGSSKRINRELVFEMTDIDSKSQRRYQRMLVIANYAELLNKGLSVKPVHGSLDVAEFDTRGKLLKLRTYAIQSLEIPHSAELNQ